MPAAAAGRRLDAWLAEALGGTRAAAQRLIDSGCVLVDGSPRPKSFRLAGGERIVSEGGPRPGPLEPAAAEPSVAWEDELLLVIDKPAGLVVHPAPGHRRQTLVDLLAERAGGQWTPLVVHRLDRDTSGLMLVAKDEQVRRRLQEAIRAREVERVYLALVKGRPASRTGTIEAPLGRDRRMRTRMSSDTQRPRAARTHFALERALPEYTLVRARLETGRTHQIRAHFAAIGHPLAGDRDYGGPPVEGLARQFLHSTSLAFHHPGTGRRLELQSELPGDLAAALERVARPPS